MDRVDKQFWAELRALAVADYAEHFDYGLMEKGMEDFLLQFMVDKPMEDTPDNRWVICEYLFSLANDTREYPPNKANELFERFAGYASWLWPYSPECNAVLD